jgi:hypothetical protein
MEFYIQNIHHGRSDLEEKPSAFDKLSGFFKKKESHAEYPRDVYDGPVDITNRENEAERHELHQFASKYHDGYYISLPSTSKAEQPGYYPPIGQVYSGDVSSTHYNEAGQIPLEQHVQVYHPGRSDEKTSFKKEERTEYPPIGQVYSGDVSSTHYNEAGQIPLEQHVQVYHPGRSDERPSTIDKLTGFFKKEERSEYPRSERFEGRHDDMTRSVDLERHPIESYSTVYSSGKSDEEPQFRPLPRHQVSLIREQVQVLKGYPPITEPYYGSIDETRARAEMEALPLDQIVNVYSHGHSDLAEKKHSLLEKIGDIFRKSHINDDYPTKTPVFEGEHDLIRYVFGHFKI